MKEVYKIPVLSVGVADGTKKTGKPNALFLWLSLWSKMTEAQKLWHTQDTTQYYYINHNIKVIKQRRS